MWEYIYSKGYFKLFYNLVTLIFENKWMNRNIVSSNNNNNYYQITSALARSRIHIIWVQIINQQQCTISMIITLLLLGSHVMYVHTLFFMSGNERKGERNIHVIAKYGPSLTTEVKFCVEIAHSGESGTAPLLWLCRARALLSSDQQRRESQPFHLTPQKI